MAEFNTETETLAEAVRTNLFAPAQEMSTLGRKGLPMLKGGEGIYVIDSEGRRLIDGPAGMWCTQIGYGRREIADALADQSMHLSYNSPWYTSNSPAAKLAARIAEMTPGDLTRIFFTTGGSTAVDTALRFTEFYNNILGRPQKKKIVVRMDGYHGSTSLTAACSGRTGNWPPTGYHARFKAVCEANDIIYISDEVVTGFGRCGEWFASEKVFGVVPDIITFAKGVTSGYVPLGGLAISEKLLDRVSGENAKGGSFTNGYTYSGHPVSCAAALANIEVIERDGILAHVNEVSVHFAAALKALEDLPGVADIRSKGLVGCVECMVDPGRSEVTDADKALGLRIDEICFSLGLIVRPIGNMCVLSPPLIITRQEIDSMCEILREGILRAGEEKGAAQRSAA